MEQRRRWSPFFCHSVMMVRTNLPNHSNGSMSALHLRTTPSVSEHQSASSTDHNCRVGSELWRDKRLLGSTLAPTPPARRWAARTWSASSCSLAPPLCYAVQAGSRREVSDYGSAAWRALWPAAVCNKDNVIGIRVSRGGIHEPR
jgi:hypothetical protein